MTSSCRHELPAATALAVAIVMPFVIRMKSSGVETLAGGTGEEKTCEARGGGEVWGSHWEGWQLQQCSCTHRQLLAYVFYRGLQCPCPLRGLVLNGLHCLQQGSDICHHHLWKGTETGEAPRKLCAAASTCPSLMVWSKMVSFPYFTHTTPSRSPTNASSACCAPPFTCPFLSSCSDRPPVVLLLPERQRSPPCSFSSLPCPIPSFPSHPVRPWQSSSAGRQQGHPQLCRRLPWWHRSGLRVPWPHPSQH